MARKEQRTTRKGVPIRFDANEHRYYLGNDVVISTTQFMKDFYPSTDFKKITYSLASNNSNWSNLTPEEIDLLWTLKANIGKNTGNIAHDYLQSQFIRPGYITPKNDLTRAAQNCFDFIVSKFDIIEAEQFHINEKYKMGYTTDLVLRAKKTGVMFIGDYKGSESFTTEQYKASKKRNAKKLNRPFDFLTEVTGDTVKLQTAIYKHLYNDDYDANVKNTISFHISPALYEKGFQVYIWPDEEKLIDELVTNVLATKIIVNENIDTNPYVGLLNLM